MPFGYFDNSKIFKSYILVNPDKSPICGKGHSWITKSEYHLPLSEAKRFDSYAGILREGIVCVDVDNLEYAEKLLDIIKTEEISSYAYRTDKGMHFYFKEPEYNPLTKNSEHVQLACGLMKTDVFTGRSNKYLIRKLNGNERKNVLLPKNNELDELPCWLRPLKGVIDGEHIHGDVEYFHVYGLGEGSRNSVMFEKARRFAFYATGSIDDTKETCLIINRHMLSKPLSTREMSVILRNDAFAEMCHRGHKLNASEKEIITSERIRMNTPKNTPRNIAETIKRKYFVRKVNGNLSFIYKGNRIEDEDILMRIIDEELGDTSSIRRQDEVKENLRRFSDKCTYSKDAIKIGDRLFNTSTKKFEDCTEEIIPATVIPHNYKPDAYCKTTDEFLNTVLKTEANRKLFIKYLAYMLIPNNKNQKALSLIGKSGSGKSTLLNMTMGLIGEENTAHHTLEDFGEKFGLTDIKDKALCLLDDVTTVTLNNISLKSFNRVVSGQPVTLDTKHGKASVFEPRCKILISANADTPVEGGSEGWDRRILKIKMNDVLVWKPEYNELFSKQSYEYLLKLAVEELISNNTDKDFFSKETYNELNEQRMLNACNEEICLIEFVKSVDINGLTSSELLDKFCEYTLKNNLMSLSYRKLFLYLNSIGYKLKSKRFNGKIIRVYERA